MRIQRHGAVVATLGSAGILLFGCVGIWTLSGPGAEIAWRAVAISPTVTLAAIAAAAVQGLQALGNYRRSALILGVSAIVGMTVSTVSAAVHSTYVFIAADATMSILVLYGSFLSLARYKN